MRPPLRLFPSRGVPAAFEHLATNGARSTTATASRSPGWRVYWRARGLAAGAFSVRGPPRPGAPRLLPSRFAFTRAVPAIPRAAPSRHWGPLQLHASLWTFSFKKSPYATCCGLLRPYRKILALQRPCLRSTKRWPPGHPYSGSPRRPCTPRHYAAQ